MRKITSMLAAAAVVLGGLASVAPAAAATAWDYSGGSFQISDGQGGTGTVTVSNLRITGSSASGHVGLSNARYSCSSQGFSGLTANFFTGLFDPCTGTITFSVDSAGVLSVTDSSVYIPSTFLSGPGTGSAQGTPYPREVTCVATRDGATGARLTISDSGTGAGSYDITASPAAPSATIPSVAASGTSSGPVPASITGLDLGTDYTFTVSPVGGSGSAGTCTVRTEEKPQAPVGTATFGAVSGSAASPLQEVNLTAPAPATGWTLAWTRKDGTAVTPPLQQACTSTETYVPTLVRPDVSTTIVGADLTVTATCAVDTPAFVGGIIAGQSVTVNYTLPAPALPGVQVWAKWRPSGARPDAAIAVSLGSPAPGSTAGSGSFTASGLRVPQSAYVRLYTTNGPLTSGNGNENRILGETPRLSYPTPVTGSEGGTTAREANPVSADAGLLSSAGFQYSVAPGSSLPNGLSLDRNTGVVQSNGQPLAAFTGTVTIQLKDVAGRVVTAPVTIQIAPAPPAPGSFAYPPARGYVGTPFWAVPTRLAPPRFFFSPDLCARAPGLDLSNANGSIQGIPQLALKGTFVVIASRKPGDPCSAPASSDFIARTTVSIQIGQPQVGFTVNYAQQSVNALVGSAINDPATVLPAGLTGLRFAVTSGVLPAGLALDAATGAITGVPTTPVVSQVVITVSFNSRTTATTVAFTILPVPSGANAGLAYPNVAAAPATVPLSVLPSGAVTGQTFSLDAASLAAGMAIDPATGKITWTPKSTQRGTATVTVTVAANGTSATLAPFTITVVAAPATSRPATTPTTAAPSAGVAATGGTGGSSGASGSGQQADQCLAPNGTIYSDIHGSAGSTLTMAPNTIGLPIPASFTVTGGSLPSGVWLDGNAGVISGTPERSNGGQGAVEITTTWPDGTVRVSDFMIAIDDPHHAVNYPNRIIGSIGESVAVTPFEVNAVGATTYQLVCGELPPGLVLNAATGVVSGTPTGLVERPVPLRLRMTDSYGWVDSSFILVVDPGVTPWLRYPELAELGYGRKASIVPTRSGLPPSDSYRITGKLPRGLTLNAKTGVISGVAKVRNGLVYEPTITAIGVDGQPQVSTVPSMTVVKPAVPMRVTARPVTKALKRGSTIVVVRVKHPVASRLTTRVTCSSCTHSFNTKTGRMVVKVAKAGTTVKVRIVALPVGKARTAYAGHVWTRIWRVR